MKETVSIIDIGTTKIVAIIAEKNENNKIRVLGFGETKSEGIEHGIIKNIPAAIKKIKQAVSQAEEQAQIKMQAPFVGIAGHFIKTERTAHTIVLNNDNIEIPVREKHIRNLIDDVYKISVGAEEKIMHVIPLEYFINNENNTTENPLMMPTRVLGGNFLIVKGNKREAELISTTLTNIGLKPEAFILEPMAAAEAVLEEEEKLSGTVLVDIGGGTTDVVIVKDKKIIDAFIVPFGGENITYDISKVLKTTQDIAKKLKEEYGTVFLTSKKENQTIEIPGIAGRMSTTTTLEHLSKIIMARVLEIVDTIRMQIREKNVNELITTGVTITGGGAKLKNLDIFWKFRTDWTVRIGNPKLDAFENPPEFLQDPKYATAVGLILMGFQNLRKINNKENTTRQEQEGTEETQEQENKAKKEKRKFTLKGLFESVKNFFTDESPEINDEK